MGMYSNDSGLMNVLKALRVGLAGYQGYSQAKQLQEIEAARQAQAQADLEQQQWEDQLKWRDMETAIEKRQKDAENAERDDFERNQKELLAEIAGVDPVSRPIVEAKIRAFQERYGDRPGVNDLLKPGGLATFLGDTSRMAASGAKDIRAAISDSAAATAGATPPEPNEPLNMMTPGGILGKYLKVKSQMEASGKVVADLMDKTAKMTAVPSYRAAGYADPVEYANKVLVPYAAAQFTIDELYKLAQDHAAAQMFLFDYERTLRSRGASDEVIAASRKNFEQLFTGLQEAAKAQVEEDRKLMDHNNEIARNFINNEAVRLGGRLVNGITQMPPLDANGQADWVRSQAGAMRAAEWASTHGVYLDDAMLWNAIRNYDPQNDAFKLPEQKPGGPHVPAFDLGKETQAYLNSIGAAPPDSAGPGQPVYTIDNTTDPYTAIVAYPGMGFVENVTEEVANKKLRILGSMSRATPESIQRGKEKIQRNVKIAGAPPVSEAFAAIDSTKPPQSPLTKEVLSGQGGPLPNIPGIPQTGQVNLLAGLLRGSAEATNQGVKQFDALTDQIGRKVASYPGNLLNAASKLFVAGGVPRAVSDLFGDNNSKGASKPGIDQDAENPPMTADEQNQRFMEDLLRPPSYGSIIFDGTTYSRGSKR